MYNTITSFSYYRVYGNLLGPMKSAFKLYFVLFSKQVIIHDGYN